MKTAVLAAGIASAFGTPTLESVSFEQYVKDFKHNWSGEEYALRKNIFEEELKNVLSHNAAGLTWKKTLNKYSAWTQEEKKAHFGRNKAVDRAHKPMNALPMDLELKDVSELPTDVDWRNTANTVTAVKDQGHCGSCWAFAATAVLESHVALSTGLLYDFSPQQIAMCAPNPQSCGGTGGCEGATAEIAFDYVASAGGALEEYQLGYTAYGGADSACGFDTATMTPVASITGFTQLAENNYTALMNAIAQVGPIAVSVDASNWHAYDKGIFDGCDQKTPDINHAVTLVGYGEENGQKYWTIRNSWSPSWGELGYIRLARDDADEEKCGMDVTPHDGTACEGEDAPVKVCGTCGVLYDSAYPVGAALA